MSGVTNELRKEAAIVSFGDTLIPRRTALKQATAIGDQGLFEPLVIPVDKHQRKFVSDLRRAIYQRVDFESLELLEMPAREAIVQGYGLCFGRLKGLIDEWSQFVRVLVRIDCVQNGPRMKHVDDLIKSKAEKWQKEICSDPDLRAFMLRSVVTSELMSADVSKVLPKLVEDIRNKCEAFAERCIDQLSRLVDLNVCGLVRRFPNYMTEYHFFYRQLDGVITSQTPHYRREYVNRGDVGMSFWKDITSVVIEGEATRTLCRRVHHLMHTIEIRPECASIYIPQLQRELYASCPTWVKPMVRMIEGTMIGEAKIDVDEQPDPFGATIVQKEVLTPAFYPDPAFVLGQFVLTGWGPDEIQAEKRLAKSSVDAARNNTNKTFLPNFKRYGNQWVSSITAICAVILMVSGGGSLIGPLALLSAAVGWSVFWNPTEGHFRFHADIAVLAVLVAVLTTETVILLDADRTLRALMCLLLACVPACLALYRSTLIAKLS